MSSAQHPEMQSLRAGRNAVLRGLQVMGLLKQNIPEAGSLPAAAPAA